MALKGLFAIRQFSPLISKPFLSKQSVIRKELSPRWHSIKKNTA
jgi:hypothetical protein